VLGALEEIWRPTDYRPIPQQLGEYRQLQGDYARAHAPSTRNACPIFRESNDRTGIAWSLNYQGDVARDHGDVESAAVL